MPDSLKENLSILLVDDEAQARRLIQSKLQTIPNVSITGLPNGLAAKEYLIQHAVDLVITDIRMPIMDGLELAEFISTFCPETIIAIISGYSEFEYAEKAIRFGVKHYLLKPIQIEQLVKIVLDNKTKSVENRLIQMKMRYHKDFEQERIINDILNEKSADCGMDELESLFPCKGTVVSITPLYDGKYNKEELNHSYKNLISGILSTQSVISLGYQNNDFRFLIIPGQNLQARSLDAVPEYLNRILQNGVKWTVIAGVNSISELRDLEFSSVTDVSVKVIESACQFMKEHLGEPISRNMVAEHVYLSHSHFGHLFRQVMGMGYNAYLTQLRIDQAKKLLQSNMAVGDVAIAVGYRDAKYFSEIFYQKTGCFPSDYKFLTLGAETAQEE